jgi:23S rRNA pseudouridine1911/1915/1917 synthase
MDKPSSTKRFEFAAASNDQGVRVDEFLMMRIGSLSRMRIRNLIADGQCTVNGNPGRAGQKLASHDVVIFEVPEGPPTSMDPDPIPLEIVHEDEQIIVIVKPAGMLVHPTRGVKRGTLTNALAYHLNRTGAGEPESFVRPGLVHRLDRVTSGLMVVARTQRALATLSRHFKRRLVERRYLAVVEGCVSPDQGVVNAPIGRDPEQLPHWRVLESGRPAETRFRVIEREKELTLVELEPSPGARINFESIWR